MLVEATTDLIKRMLLIESHSYGCVMAICNRAPFDLWRAYQINPADCHSEDCEASEPHITVKYGIHAGVSPQAIAQAIAGYRKPKIEAILGKISAFPAEQTHDKQYDVVKIDVHSPDLFQLNAMISTQVPCTDSYPVYRPHLTLAYLLPGRGQRYVGSKVFEGVKLTFNRLCYSDSEDRSTIIAIKPDKRY